MALSRRNLAKTGLALLGGSCLPPRVARADDGGDPHFFLFVNLFLGADPSNLFDARRLDLTAAGKMQNYYGKDPQVWTGSNGTATLATAVVEPLKEFRDVFSVVNGVMMSSFDGHDQNQNFIFTGNGLGGESFVPHLNVKAALPLDNVVMSSTAQLNVTNNGATLTSTPATMASLGQSFTTGQAFPAGDPTLQLIGDRMQAASQGGGLFSVGAKNLWLGMQNSGGLASKLRNINIIVPPTVPTVSPTAATAPTATPPPAVPSVNSQVIGQLFLNGITRSLLVGLSPSNISLFDTHGPGDAKAQPATFANVVNDLVGLLRYLKLTPYDSNKGTSLLDVTTFVVGSEFGRTMRQAGRPIDGTGTDHNPLNNSFLIGGKGIKGGQVIGASDCASVDATGNFVGVSGAHKQLDPSLIKLMGQTFDYSTFAPLAAQPTTFDNTQYLSFGAITNTVYDIFGYGVADAPYRRFSQGGDIIPVLKPLKA